MPVTNPLLRYSAAATAFLAGAIPVQGQMVFTDVDPDLILPVGDAYDLDLNNDGTIDFVISHQESTAPSFFYVSSSFSPDARMEHGLVQPLSLNSVAGQLPGLLYAYQLPVDYLVGYDLNFHQETAQLFYKLQAVDYPAPGSLFTVSSEGNFPAETEGFVPLNFRIDDAVRFGWVRLAVNADMDIVVMSYAYEATVEEPAVTFIDTTQAIQPAAFLEPTVYAAGEMLFIDLSEVTEQAIYTIHDLGGRHLLEGTVSGQGLYSRTLSLPAGVYVITLTWEGQRYVRRIFL